MMMGHEQMIELTELGRAAGMKMGFQSGITKSPAASKRIRRLSTRFRMLGSDEFGNPSAHETTGKIHLLQSECVKKADHNSSADIVPVKVGGLFPAAEASGRSGK